MKNFSTTSQSNHYESFKARAFLRIMSGADENGESFPVYGDTILGRVRGEADILFHQDGQLSPVSARHCTLIDDEDGWFIRDEGSTNGTYLEGHRLEPGRKEELPDKSIIYLAPKQMGGVQLKFVVFSKTEDLCSRPS